MTKKEKTEKIEESVEKKVSRISKKKRVVTLLVVNLICILCLTVVLSVYGKVFYHETKYAISSLFSDEIKNSKKYYEGLPTQVTQGEDILREPIVQIPEPVDPNFSVVIPKLDINQRVISNVNINNPEEVEKALGEGIGWAFETVEPGSEGNSLLFSHSTQNAWEIFRYNSVFTLLRKLEINDMFTVVYQGRQMDFLVFEKYTVPAEDTSYLTSVAKGRVVTLQTCDPPGSQQNRLIVRGRLVAREVR